MNTTVKQKKERLGALRDEVKEFHPLLDDLLRKVPRVKRVEYTHGQFEQGADFVLFREDDALGDTEYVGVIVKTGKIVSDISKIREQIRECGLHRYAVNGKRTINLDEIWVLTNEHISKAAQYKIYEEFKSTKIKFVQSPDVICWIDNYLPNFWGIKNAPIARYLDSVVAGVKKDTEASSLIPKTKLSDRMSLGFRPIETEYKSKKKKERSTPLEELVKKYDVVYIEGEAGSGKTHTIRKTVMEICSTEFYEQNKLVPFLINYADFHKNFSLDIGELLKSNEFKAVLELLDDGSKILLFIDGVDELILNRRNIRDEFGTLFEHFEHIDNVQVVLTTRPLNLGNYDEILPRNAIAVEIDRMSVKQVMQMLKSTCEEAKISDRLWKDIQDSDLFKQLPRNPISTLLLAQLINDNHQDLPSNLTDVYSRYIEVMLGGWDIEKGLQSRKEYECAIAILGRMAEYFLDNDLTCIGKNEAFGFFREYLVERNTGVCPKELFGKCLSRSGVILEDHSERICFKHRSFAEYLYALRKFNDHAEKFIDDRIYSVQWRTIYFFYIGLHKDCEGLLSRMMSESPKDINQKFWRFVNMGEYLLAGYTTPYKIVNESLPILFREVKDLYFDIVKRRENSPLSDMPEMFVLHFFQAVSSSCYSYRFFIDALDSCVLDVLADKSMDQEEKAYTTFFISTIYRALKLPNPFDGLLEKFDKDIPIQIRLGVFYNTDAVDSHSTLLNRNKKWVLHEMKKNPQLNRYVKKLHELPVGKVEK